MLGSDSVTNAEAECPSEKNSLKHSPPRKRQRHIMSSCQFNLSIGYADPAVAYDNSLADTAMRVHFDDQG
jgi:hypothetical protein